MIVYLDHHFIADPNCWPIIKALSDRGQIRVAISSWNIREIAQGMLERAERMEFLESLAPLYIHDMQVLQRLEVVSFLNMAMFGGQRVPFAMFTETFADSLLMNLQVKVRPDYQLSDYIRAEGDVTGDAVDLAMETYVVARNALLANPDGVKRSEEQANHATMTTLIPRRGFDGRHWEPSQIADMLIFCHRNRRPLLRACPAIFAEDALVRARQADPTRRPKKSDTADLFHSVSALAYADVFLTNDGWARGKALVASRAMQARGVASCKVLRTLGELQQLVTN